MVGLIEDPDEASLDDIREIAVAAEQGDLAVAIDLMREVEEADEDGDLDEDEIDLPFYEEDRELAFVLGMMVGGILQASEQDGEDEQTETEQTVEQSQEQSVTVTA